ncbi:ribosome maturation factor RimM [Acaryochloris sp. IP29b_bin.148]|uniref:ribosome maturation factor RimM n=1 Tax=Acaryochloris sp. IP29b_bin.148 TaxID=2969218 RepID=UPI00261C9DD2|nr:ribosome maturation factor RimM [Acaryochloris sp. IP29b_bin.148]
MSDTFSSQPLADPALEEWLEVGTIIGAHGLNGEVKVFPESDFPERFTQPGLRWLSTPTHPSTPEEIQLLKGRFVERKGIYVVKLANVNFRDQSEALKGAKLLVRSSDRPQLAEGEYYLSDLMGLTVIDQQTQTVVGSVVSIASAGNDLLEIQLVETNQTVLVPFVPALVPLVDIAANRIEISPPKGLIPGPHKPST